MFLSEFLNQAARGELSQVSIGTNGIIDSADYPKIVGHINMGLTALHTEFNLREKELIIDCTDDLIVYTLSSKHAVSNTDPTPVKYIRDTVEQPYINDLLKVERVYDELGTELPLNDSSKENSVFTPGYNRLQLPDANSTKSYSVIYRANHPTIVADGSLNPSIVELEIADSFIEPLLYFVAARIFYPMAADTNGSHEGSRYMNLYRQAVQNIKNLGIDAQEETTNDKLERAGWL